MKTIDTNLLVYAHREEMDNHHAARTLLERIVNTDEPWVLLWPCLYEFTRIVTHPKLFHPPTPAPLAMKALNSLIESCTAVLAETENHFRHFQKIMSETKCKGNHVFDAHIAALMREHGVEEIITSDKDFYQFKGIRVIEPF